MDGVMSPLSFNEHGSPGYAEYDIVNLGRTGFIQVIKNSPLFHSNIALDSDIVAI